MTMSLDVKSRLDAVVKLRERDEDRALTALADAQKQAQAADRALADAIARARHDDRGRGSAASWELSDVAHARALLDARDAEREARAANDQVGASRQRYVGAHARAEAMRRFAETRRHEAVRAAEEVERKSLDEVAVLMFARR